MNTLKYIWLFFLVAFAGCRERYDIAVKPAERSLLVVDGNLNNGQGPTYIHLSRTVNTNDIAQKKPELFASLSIEGKDNSINTLIEYGDGLYGIPQSNMITGQEYRLKIRTRDGRMYLSDYILAKKNPQIDSIGWTRTNDGVSIFVNTHDPENNTWYYRWEYSETFEIHSHYYSSYKYIPATNMVVPRQPGELVYVCWKTDSSTNILLGSSAKLQSDVISEAPVQFIPFGSEKLTVRYSILVRQFALSKQAFDYLQVMKKNTESIGSFFGVLPSELKGNIHCLSDPAEQVIGFLTASPVLEKRIFISKDDVPDWYFSMDCIEILVPNNPDSFRMYYPYLIPYEAVTSRGPAIIGYRSSEPFCVDCTFRGGNLVKPSFW